MTTPAEETPEGRARTKSLVLQAAKDLLLLDAARAHVDKTKDYLIGAEAKRRDIGIASIAELEETKRRIMLLRRAGHVLEQQQFNIVELIGTQA